LFKSAKYFHFLLKLIVILKKYFFFRLFISTLTIKDSVFENNQVGLVIATSSQLTLSNVKIIKSKCNYTGCIVNAN